MKHPLTVFVTAGITCGLLIVSCSTSSPGGGSLPPATKDAPFVNSLGMKFVPVPGTNILMCTTETTVSQYQAAGLGYKAPPFNQSSDHPAVNVNWNEAKAWCAWISRKEGRKYRLPTSAEWSAAVGATTYAWGNQWPPPNDCENLAGQELRGCTPGERALIAHSANGQLSDTEYLLIGGFRDHHKFTSPVGSYSSNALGIHDLGGNANEWCEDKAQDYRLIRGNYWCGTPVSRGQGGDLRRWFAASSVNRAAANSHGELIDPNTMAQRGYMNTYGFRVVLAH